MMGSKAFENPLMSHARMRAMFRALVETRLLGQRAGRGLAVPKGLEACWVATGIDLRPGDLFCGVHSGWMTDYIRAIGRREAAKAATTAEIKRVLREMEQAKKADTAGFKHLSSMERMLCAVGSAIALRTAGQGCVAMAYVGRGELTANEWKRLLAVTNEDSLPLVIVATPDVRSKRDADIGAIAARMKYRNVPVIPVDAGDTLALYRVAQESIGRARADNMAAVIECIECGNDPVRMMSAQLVKKQICTERWVENVETPFRASLARI
jgi:acetoin:2,6-dichlorophenolindophenol oxidoreductase subunit alpha